MSDSERLQSPGDFFIDGVLIVGSSGARINVTDQVRELNIYQYQYSFYIWIYYNSRFNGSCRIITIFRSRTIIIFT